MLPCGMLPWIGEKKEKTDIDVEFIQPKQNEKFFRLTTATESSSSKQRDVPKVRLKWRLNIFIYIRFYIYSSSYKIKIDYFILNYYYF